jgi:hypothetical protein
MIIVNFIGYVIDFSDEGVKFAVVAFVCGVSNISHIYSFY